MNDDHGEPDHTAIALPNGHQDHASPSDNGSVRPFPYWTIAFDGRRLRQRRRERDLSQERLSHRSGVSLRTIQRVEQLPVASCHRRTLHRLASALSPDPASLIAQLTEGITAPANPAASHKPARQAKPDQWWLRARPFPASRTGHPRYDAAMARELLATTGEFPDSKGGMLMLLTEYRCALHDLATALPGWP